ncbi:hypothetical protein ACQ4PT_061566 [Festuca glaucescens]
MSVRLSRPPGGDPHSRNDPERIHRTVSGAAGVDASRVVPPLAGTIIPLAAPPPSSPSTNLLPIDLKFRLRSIILRSPDPQKSINLFRSKFLQKHSISNPTPSNPPAHPDIPPPAPFNPISADVAELSPAPTRVTASNNLPFTPIGEGAITGPTELARNILDSDDAGYHSPTARRGVTGEESARYLNGMNQRNLDPGGRTIKMEVGWCHSQHHSLSHPTLDQFAMESKSKSSAVAASPATATPPKGDKLIIPGAPPHDTITTKASGAGPSRQRKDKGILVDERTEEERTPLVVNMAKARGLNCARFLAVGVFLSFLAMPSKQLISYMKRLSEEGDYDHVTRGGPWRYADDAVLIRALKEGEDPATVSFYTVPIWAQFAGIPFYLLSKELARDLGKKLGTLVSIDNNSRGDICNKILRARILLPLQRALQRQITLEDAITNEEVVVSVSYERLPNFCLFCGVIGHREANCILPEALKKMRYSPCLGVKATSGADERRWHLPATAGQTRRPLHMAAPWRIVLPTVSRMEANLAIHQLAIVSHVAKEVARLSVQDREPEGDGSGVGEEKNTSLAASSVANKAHVEAPAPNGIDKTLVPNNDTIKNIDPKPSADKVCIPSDNTTAASEKEKEEEAQSTLGSAVLGD